MKTTVIVSQGILKHLVDQCNHHNLEIDVPQPVEQRFQNGNEPQYSVSIIHDRAVDMFYLGRAVALSAAQEKIMSIVKK